MQGYKCTLTLEKCILIFVFQIFGSQAPENAHALGLYFSDPTVVSFRKLNDLFLQNSPSILINFF